MRKVAQREVAEFSVNRYGVAFERNRGKKMMAGLCLRSESSRIERRDFLRSVTGACTGWATAAVVQGANEQPSDRPTKQYRVIDTHLHLFNSRLGGTRGIPKLLSLDATIEGAVAAMRHGGVDKAFLITYNAQDIAEQFIGRDIGPARVQHTISKDGLNKTSRPVLVVSRSH